MREKVLSWLADLVDSDLRYEAQHGSALARFLVRHALQNPLMIGHFIFGLLVDYEEYLLQLPGDHLEPLEQHVLDKARLRVLSGVQNDVEFVLIKRNKKASDKTSKATFKGKQKKSKTVTMAPSKSRTNIIRVWTRTHGWWRGR